MLCRLGALAGLLLLTDVSLAQKKPVTIESITATQLRRRGLSAVVWSPEGKRFAYREGEKIWIYEIASQQSKEIVSFARLGERAVKPATAESFDWQNRRVAERSFQWSSSGQEMLVSAGGDLFLVHLVTGGYEQLTATSEAERDPKLSPDGRYVSFRREHDLYTLEIDTRKVRRLTHDGSATLWNGELDWVYPEELELPTAHWWSPDSKRIAYLQFDVSREPLFPQVDLLGARAKFEPQRYPKAGDPNADVHLGVVSFQGGDTKWMDVGETRDALLARVHWSPDSSGLAVERLNRIQNRLDLLRTDALSGVATLLLREQDNYWINVTDHFRYLKDSKEFLWSSERDGFRHLYRYSADGKRSNQITRGEWEVTDIACVDERAREVFFVSTEQSPLEQHFYGADLDGHNRRRLSVTPGMHTISMSPDCSHYLDTASSIKLPPRHTLHERTGAQVAIVREPDTRDSDEYQILATEIVSVKASDGALLYARLIKPAGFAPGRKYPVIVMIYGGPHVQAVRNAWSGANWDQVLAHRGFVIWQLDNRGSSGRGHRWESMVSRNLGAQELEDQKQGIRHLQSLGFVDTARMGIYGWSYGGFMALYSLSNAPGLFRAGVAGAPVTDWRNYDTIYTERYMGLPQDNIEGYKSSSPLSKAADLTAKLLLVHNLEDDNVHFQNTVQMVDALELAGKQFELLVYPQKSHGVSGPVRKQLYESVTAFFERNLR